MAPAEIGIVAFVGIGIVLLLWHEIAAKQGKNIPAAVSMMGVIWLLAITFMLFLVQTKRRW